MSADNDDFDIYGDLNLNISTTSTAIVSNISNDNDDDLHNEVHLYGELNTLENDRKILQENNAKLSAENAELKKTLEVKNKQIQVLKNNISSLYKTAKNELDRRCTELAELRREYDSLVFRRLAQFKQKQQETATATVNGDNNQTPKIDDCRTTSVPSQGLNGTLDRSSNDNHSLDIKLSLETNEQIRRRETVQNGSLVNRGEKRLRYDSPAPKINNQDSDLRDGANDSSRNLNTSNNNSYNQLNQRIKTRDTELDNGYTINCGQNKSNSSHNYHNRLPNNESKENNNQQRFSRSNQPNRNQSFSSVSKIDPKNIAESSKESNRTESNGHYRTQFSFPNAESNTDNYRRSSSTSSSSSRSFERSNDDRRTYRREDHRRNYRC